VTGLTCPRSRHRWLVGPASVPLAKAASDLGQERIHLQRLGEHPARRRNADALKLRSGVAGDEQARQLRHLRRERFEQLDAVQARHGDVGDDQIEQTPGATHELERLRAVTGLVDTIPVLVEESPDDSPNIGLIIHDQNPSSRLALSFIIGQQVAHRMIPSWAGGSRLQSRDRDSNPDGVAPQEILNTSWNPATYGARGNAIYIGRRARAFVSPIRLTKHEIPKNQMGRRDIQFGSKPRRLTSSGVKRCGQRDGVERETVSVTRPGASASPHVVAIVSAFLQR
jgi:hypothetical protein